jgi:hypothetical protein
LVHVDHATSQILIVGKISASGVREIDVLQDGHSISAIKASAHAPTVKIISPRAHARLGGRRGALLRWRSHDPDHDSLTATVRYSRNGGRTWSTVYGGPDLGRARLPGYLMSASRNARVRVYVSDGFNEAIATSKRFISLGAPPIVSITSPTRGARIRAGSSLNLAGTAYEDTGRRLTRGSLVWRSGRSILGHGAQISTAALAAGRHKITLTAHDRHGRAQSAAVQVTILPSPPQLILVKSPRHVSPKARSFGLRLATVAPSRLTIGHLHTLIDRRPRTINVRIKPGHTAVSLVMTLRSGPFTSKVIVTVRR